MWHHSQGTGDVPYSSLENDIREPERELGEARKTAAKGRVNLPGGAPRMERMADGDQKAARAKAGTRGASE